jgi:hypothetical protein
MQHALQQANVHLVDVSHSADEQQLLIDLRVISHNSCSKCSA